MAVDVRGILQLVLIGVISNNSVEATGRSAGNLGFKTADAIVQLALVADVRLNLAELGSNLVDGGVISAVGVDEVIFNGVELLAQTFEMVLVNGLQLGHAGVQV